MKILNPGLWVILILVLNSCATIRDTPRYQLSDGYYKSNVFNNHQNAVYIDNSEDTIFVYLANRLTKQVDSLTYPKITFPQLAYKNYQNSSIYKQPSFDVDFLTIPFKVRPSQKDFPGQFNTNLNGAVYLGYRNDVYQLQYKQTPLGYHQRQIRHYGFSFGFITGFGGTTVNPSVTNSQIAVEYDGIVWSKGAAAIFGINNFSIGLAVGYDNLLDNNSKYWIYQHKSWLGLAFGLNLN